MDPFPEKASARPLVLDAGEQRGLSRAMRSGGEESSNLADDMRALLEMRLKAMAGDGRRGQAIGYVVMALQDAVREPAFAHEPPDAFDEVERHRTGRERHRAG